MKSIYTFAPAFEKGLQTKFFQKGTTIRFFKYFFNVFCGNLLKCFARNSYLCAPLFEER